MARKILLLWDRMGDYHRARWSALAKALGSANCHAADLGTGDKLYLWASTTNHEKYHCLVNKPVEQVNPLKALRSFRQIVLQNKITHVCIPGYGRLAYILMMAWAKFAGVKVMMCAESWYERDKLTDTIKGLLVKMVTDVCFVSGKRAFDHFRYGLKYNPKRMLEGYSVVDNSHFEMSSEIICKATPPQLLCVARHVPEKNLTLLIEAFKKSHLSKAWQLRLVGGGPLKLQLEVDAREANIIIDNWLTYDKLPEMYHQASCFILPSKFEPWGLVVNEAMAASLPIILSSNVGALPDLITADNGWQFESDNIEDCTRVLDNLFYTSSDNLIKMGNSSKDIIREFSLESWAGKIARWVDLPA